MNDILYTVHVDGTDKKFKKGTTYQEIARTYQQEYQHDIVLVFVDGRLQELFKTLETDCELKFVTTADPLGYKSYRRRSDRTQNLLQKCKSDSSESNL